jgi:hypothetical protein
VVPRDWPRLHDPVPPPIGAEPPFRASEWSPECLSRLTLTSWERSKSGSLGPQLARRRAALGASHGHHGFAKTRRASPPRETLPRRAIGMLTSRMRPERPLGAGQTLSGQGRRDAPQRHHPGQGPRWKDGVKPLSEPPYWDRGVLSVPCDWRGRTRCFVTSCTANSELPPTKLPSSVAQPPRFFPEGSVGLSLRLDDDGRRT